MNPFVEKIKSFMEEHHMVQPGDTVICGLSGGADSVCLLNVLAGLRPALGINLAAIHVHHGIRGEEADRDEAFAGKCAEKLGIPFESVHENAPEYARKYGLSEEEAGRELRRKAFRDLEERLKKDPGTKRVRIATAHHKDDNAETVLFQLSRGTGLAGLAGIRPVAENRIRPLLIVTRKEIEAWLLSENIPYVTDSTNHTDDYARNRIRRHVLPYLEENIHEGAADHIAETAALAGEVLDYMEQEAERLAAELTECAEKPGEILLRDEAFLSQPPVMTGYLIRYCLHAVSPHQKDLTRAHIDAIRDLQRKQTGRQIDLPGITAIRTYQGILFVKAEKTGSVEKTESAEKEKTAEKERTTEKEAAARAAVKSDPAAQTQKTNNILMQKAAPSGRPECFPVLSSDGVFTCRMEDTIPDPIPEKTYTKWIDFAIISDELRVRTRQPGDFITIREDGARKSISDFMIDRKIPRREREDILLVADGSEIVWVPGYRLNARYRITQNTEKVLKIQLEAGRKTE